MNDQDAKLLHDIVFESATAIQNGTIKTGDEWFELARELRRAARVADVEGERLEEDALAEAKRQAGEV